MCPSTTKYFSPSFSYKVILSFPKTGIRSYQSPRIVRSSVLSSPYERSNPWKLVTRLVLGFASFPRCKTGYYCNHHSIYPLVRSHTRKPPVGQRALLLPGSGSLVRSLDPLGLGGDLLVGLGARVVGPSTTHGHQDAHFHVFFAVDLAREPHLL